MKHNTDTVVGHIGDLCFILYYKGGLIIDLNIYILIMSLHIYICIYIHIYIYIYICVYIYNV